MARIVFTNSSATLRYVRAAEGPDASGVEPPCEHKQKLLPVLPVGPGESRDAMFSQGTKLCFALTAFSDPGFPPYFAGIANDGDTVDVAKPKSVVEGLDSVRAGTIIQYPINALTRWPQPPYWDILFPKPQAGKPVTVGTETVLAVWRDPLTPPQTRTRCTREAWGKWPWGEEWRTCVEWATDLRWMECKLILTTYATGSNLTVDRLREVVNKCLQVSATAAALAALVALYLGGQSVAAGQAVFIEALQACLTSEITGAVFKVELRQDCHWTDWGSS